MDACKICGGRTDVTHRGVLLGRHDVAYHRCRTCDFWCTDEPHWLDEAYSDAIAATDTGLVERNLLISRRLTAVLPALFPAGPYVDWAGGCGLLVRLMRDAGFDFSWQDRYAQNLLARGFEWDVVRDGRTASVVTAMEVLEHVPDPLAFLDECLSGTGADTLIFSQQLHDGTNDPSWWYFSPVTGQHIAFYSPTTLRVIADRLGMQVQSAGTLHVLTSQPLRRGRFRLAVRSARLPARFRPGPPASLTWADHLRTVEQTASAGEA
jgi:hypothetical protein